MAVHAPFLWSQLHSSSTQSRNKYLNQPVWGEVLPTDLKAIRPAHSPDRSRKRCVVTAYVGNLFEWIFSEGVETIEPNHAAYDSDSDDDVDVDYLDRTPIPEPPKYYNFHHEDYDKAVYPRYTTDTYGDLQFGDVVEMPRDTATSWKRSTKHWYAFVTDHWTTPKGSKRMKILWLYWPEDVALCMAMKYPHPKEVCPPPNRPMVVIFQRSL